MCGFFKFFLLPGYFFIQLKRNDFLFSPIELHKVVLEVYCKRILRSKKLEQKKKTNYYTLDKLSIRQPRSKVLSPIRLSLSLSLSLSLLLRGDG